MATRHLFILNPASGRKDITEKLKQIINRLNISDPYDIFVTDAPRAAEKECFRYVREHRSDFVRVYSCGGDGTLSEVANGLYRAKSKNCAIGIVPLGSGNDFIRSFDIPAERFRNLKNLVNGEVINVDLLLARDSAGRERASLNIISVGFDAAVAKGQQKYKKLPMVNGSMAYNISLAECIFSKMKNYFTVIVDGRPVGKPGKGPYLFTIAANGKFYGGGFKAAPFSDLQDGLIDFIRVDTVSKLKFLSLVNRFRKGEYIHEYKEYVVYSQCKKLQILSEDPIDLNLDGEIHPMRDPIIEVVPGALNLIMPQ